VFGKTHYDRNFSSHLIKRMQSVMNSAAWLVYAALRYDHITPLLAQLHWLKVPERIKFKLDLCADELVVDGGVGWSYDRRRRRRQTG